MDVYLVGGAVRDELLGRPVTERDWVVVGGTPEAMLEQGYRQVGRDFPVFLHPQSGEEYALARTERKAGRGHTGFVCHAGPEVTLEDDLARRDLTVNAMARDAMGTVIDPFAGRADIAARVLRHVSRAFDEDPLRVFRVARFAAQLPGFGVAAETLALMAQMARRGDLDELSAERVWQEFYKALQAAAPGRFFQVLCDAGALTPWFREFAGAVPAPEPLAAESQALRRFGMLAWALAEDDTQALCERLKAPRRFQRVGDQVSRHGRTLAGWRLSPPEALLAALQGVGALNAQLDPEPALAAVACSSGADLGGLRELAAGLRSITSAPFRSRGLSGRALGQAIADARLDAIATAQRHAS